MTTYYVSGTGSDSNNGTATGTPLKTLQAASNKTNPGDTVKVMNGTYTGFPGGTVLEVTRAGSSSAPITYEALDGHHPIIDGTGTWNAVNIKAHWINFRGFEVKGPAASYTYEEAMAHYSTSDPKYNGNGLCCNGANHILMENNVAHHLCGAGISAAGGDYVTIRKNTSYNNAWWSPYGSSGIGVLTSVNSDSAAGPKMIVEGNTVYGNANKVPEYRAQKITDGNGIILDSNPGYNGKFLVQNNTIYDSGGCGIQTFKSDNATIKNNAIWHNNLTPTQAPQYSGEGDAAVFNNQSNNCTITGNTGKPNNVPVPPDPNPVPTAGGIEISVDGKVLAKDSVVTFKIK